MAEKIKSDEIVARDQVSVEETKHRLRSDQIKLCVAATLVVLGFFLAVGVVILGGDKLDKYRENSWTLITVIISSALGHLYSARDRN